MTKPAPDSVSERGIVVIAHRAVEEVRFVARSAFRIEGRPLECGPISAQWAGSAAPKLAEICKICPDLTNVVPSSSNLSAGLTNLGRHWPVRDRPRHGSAKLDSKSTDIIAKSVDFGLSSIEFGPTSSKSGAIPANVGGTPKFRVRRIRQAAVRRAGPSHSTSVEGKSSSLEGGSRAQPEDRTREPLSLLQERERERAAARCLAC